MKKTGNKTPPNFCWVHDDIFHVKNPCRHIEVNMKDYLNTSDIKTEPFSV